MSTFGKKALLSWDYKSNDTKRFLNSSKEIQLAILEKWYPIGDKFYMKTIYDSESEFVIGGYTDYVTFYLLCSTLHCRDTTHPLNLKEPKWVERDRNIKLLLK
jgi:hypothetical protein